MDISNPVKQNLKEFSIFRWIVLTFIAFWSNVYDVIIHSVFNFGYSYVSPKTIPPVSNQLLRESGVSLAYKIRTREVTSEEVVKLFIQRIKEVNDIVNAVVHDRFEEAIQQAIAMDQLIRNGSVSEEELRMNKPFFGVPFTSKESVAAKGMSWSLGLVCRKGKVAVKDAEIMKRLKNTGAILIAVTNIPEFCGWIESRNNVYGQTNNPYNTNKTAGGSSGGEGCIVSCCGSPFGLGTDLGGSVRIPAYFCGVYGHKLTGGLINTKGMLFRTGEEPFTIVSAGPIAKYAADLKPASAALVLPNKIALLQLDIQVDVKQLKFFYVLEPEDLRASRVDLRIKNALKHLINLISDSGIQGGPPQEVYFSGFKYSFLLWFHAVSKENIDLPRLLTDSERPLDVSSEILKKIIGKSDYTLSSFLSLLNTTSVPLTHQCWAETTLNCLRDQLLEKLGDNGVLLFPSYPTPALYHYQPFFRPFNFSYMAIFNALQLPVTQVPIGLSDQGLPIGVQIVASPYQDKLCFAVAEYIETLTGGWVPPFTS